MISEFDLERFLPYMLNQAAETISRGFQERYRVEFDLSRTQWRIIAHLGKFGGLTAKEICQRSHEEKTTVSRAVATLEQRGLLARTADAFDRRSETLHLTVAGKTLFAQLGTRATEFDRDLRNKLGKEVSTELEAILRSLTSADQL